MSSFNLLEEPSPQCASSKAAGNAAFASKDFDDAITHFTDAITHFSSSSISNDPYLSVLYNNRATAFSAIKKHGRAINDAKVCNSIHSLSLPLSLSLSLSLSLLLFRSLALCADPPVRCLQSLDLSKNRIDDPAAVELIWALPGLTLLRLEGNPVVRKIPHYRKMTISRMPHLNYLDDSPVFAKDRRLAEAFARGGLEEEKAERERFKQEAEATEARHR